MAEFEPVGVRAVVQGASKFIADLGRMEGAVRSFVATAQNIGITFANVSSGTQAAQSQLAGLSTSSATASAQIQNLDANINRGASTTQRYNAVLNNQTAAMTELANRVSFLSLRNVENLNTQTRAIAGSQSLSNQLVRLSAEYEKTRAKIASLDGQRQQVIKQMKAEERAQRGIANSIKDEQNNQTKLTERLYANIGAREDLQHRINALTLEISKLESEGSRETAQWERKLGTLAKTEGQMNQQTAIYRRLTNEIADTKNNITALNQETIQSDVRMRELSNELNHLDGEMAQAGQQAIELEGRLSRLGNVRAKIIALADAFRRAASAASMLASAALLPHRLFQGFGDLLGGLGRRIDETSRAWFKMGNSIRFFGMSLTFFLTLPILGFLKQLTDAAIDFEEAFAGVIKTVDGLVQEGTLSDLNEQGEALRQMLRDMATTIPIPAKELAELTMIAGQLGVRGVDNLTNFVDTVARLGVSTDLAAEDAARGMAQLIAVVGSLSDAELALAGFSDAEIKGISTSKRFQATVSSLGAVLVGLGNRLPTTEEAILRFSQRIAASGELVNITSAEVVGIAAAFASVGIPAERGGTAVQKTFKRIIQAIQEGGTQLEIFAQLTGLSTQQFAEAFADGSTIAGETFAKFIIGLGKNKDKAVAILQELDLNNERVFNSLVTLANAQDTAGKGQARIAESMEIVREEFKRAGIDLESFNALQLESARRFDTTASRIQLMKNQFEDLGITLGSFILPTLTKVTEAIRQLVRRIAEFAETNVGEQIVKIGIGAALAVAALGPLVIAFGLLLSSIGFVGLAIAKVVFLFSGLFSFLGILVVPVLALGAAFTGLVIAFVSTFQHISDSMGEAAEGLIPRMWRFGRELILAFARGMAQAIAAVIMVLNAIGQVIAYWLSPGSPPRLLPDIDKWGAQTFTEFLSGWLEADFGVFNQLATKLEAVIRAFVPFDAEPQDIIPRILGTRKAIAESINLVKKTGQVTAQAINKITRALGQNSTLVRDYAEALLEVGLAEERLIDAQNRLNEVTERYAKLLRPLEDRLKAIAARQEEVRRSQRITELEAILDDPRATELARELATLELEQIGLETQVDQLEDARDAELALAQAQVDAAKAQVEAAQEQLAIVEAMLDISIRNRQLIAEMEKAADSAAKKLKSALGDIGDLEGFDDIEPPEIEVPELDFAGLDQSIEDVISTITSEIELLLLDLGAIFEPLGPLWEELGETWLPIFQKIKRLLEGVFTGFNPFENVTLPSDVARIYEKFGGDLGDKILRKGFQSGDIPPLISEEDILGPLAGLEEKVFGFFDRMFARVGGFLVDIGAVEPFGPLVEQSKLLEDTGGGYLTSFGERVDGLLSDIESFINSPEIQAMVEFGGQIATTFLELTDSTSETRSELQPILDFFTRMFGILENFSKAGGKVSLSFLSDLDLTPITDAFSNLGVALGPIADALKPILGLFGTFLGFAPQIFLLVSQVIGAGVFTGLIEGIAGLINGVAMIIEGVINTTRGFFQVIGGIVDFVKSLPAVLFGALVALVTGNTAILEEGLSRANEALQTILQGAVAIIAAQFEIILGIVIGIGSAILNFVLGTIKGIANALLELVEFLPAELQSMAREALGAIKQWAEDMIQSARELVDGIIERFQQLYDDLIGESILRDLFSEALTALTTFVTDFIESIATWISDIIEDVTNFKTDFIELLQETWDLALEAIGSFIEAAIAFFTDPETGLIARFTQFGADIINGLISGIESVRGELNSLVQSIINSIPEPIREILGLESPSKLFMEFGKDMMRGWIIGIESLRGELELTTANAALGAAAAVDERVSSPSRVARANAPAALAPAGAGAQISNQIDLGGQTINNGLDVLTLQILIEQALRNALQ